MNSLKKFLKIRIKEREKDLAILSGFASSGFISESRVSLLVGSLNRDIKDWKKILKGLK